MSTKQTDKAFQLFNDRQFDQAVTAFKALIDDAETASWMKIRLRQYLAIAERKVSGTDAPEPSLKTLSYYINMKQYDTAAKVLEQVDLSEGDKTYLAAEIAIEKKDLEEAVTLLKKAISLNKHNAGYALNSPSFAPHLSDDAFNFLRDGQSEDHAA